MSGTLRFEGVGKVFPGAGPDRTDLVAADGVDLVVGAQDAVAVIGPNGAGKSTLLKMAAGVTSPTTGRIERTGRVSTVLELGTGVHPDLTGRENVDLLAALMTGERRRPGRDLTEVVEFAGLADVVDRPVRHYSTGMLARLAFSVAVHSRPDLLLVDEVLSVGDLDFQSRCRERIRELRAGGTTLLLVSHDLDLVTTLCDRAVLMVEGRVVADGPAPAVVDTYVGRPAPVRDPGGIQLQVDQESVAAGAPVVARLDVPAGRGAHSVRLDYVVGAPSMFELVEQSSSIVCATAVVPATSAGPMAVSLSTAGLPRGRYDLQATLLDEAGQQLDAGAVPFELAGSQGGFLLEVPAQLLVDGRPAGVS
jgi:ABC-2 type transport system ATP-binding protein